MQISLQNLKAHAKVDCVVIGLYTDMWQRNVERLLSSKHQEAIRIAKSQKFEAKSKQQVFFPITEGKTTRWFALLGLGKQQETQMPSWLHFGGTASRLALSVDAKSLHVVVPEKHTNSVQVAQNLARGLELGLYRYQRYKSDKTSKIGLHKISVQGLSGQDAAHALRFGQACAQAVKIARDLVNSPPNVLYPQSFARYAQALAKTVPGLKVRILDQQALKRRQMNLLLAVGQGSERPPCLVHLSYNGVKSGKGQKAPIALVGKGITFDSGGLCLKPADGMVTMKMDMGGAAAVLATLHTVAKLKLPIHVHGVLALAENMPSGGAFRTGDIFVSASGKTVEVNNTDAEGRLVLADALTYIQKEAKPREIIDLATLTGACMVALGPHTTGLFANNDAFADALRAAASASGEDFWRLPLTPALRDQLRSDVADMRNTGERYGGAITAALFLQSFIQSDVQWAHLDIAGPAWGQDNSGAKSKGGSGVAVATLLEFLAHRGQNPRGRLSNR